ncbi:MAG: DUF131 domain-containing protein [Thermococcus sp.]|nr:DUF131 domain-containing protein [Thermococcus sp.]
MDKGSALILGGMGLILVGFILIFIGTLLLAAHGEGEVEGGGVIMIGPIPIVFGTSRGAATFAMILALILMGAWIILSLIARGD